MLHPDVARLAIIVPIDLDCGTTGATFLGVKSVQGRYLTEKLRNSHVVKVVGMAGLNQDVEVLWAVVPIALPVTFNPIPDIVFQGCGQ